MKSADKGLLDRIRKLLALASDVSNVHEAALAARKAQRLMDEHNISAAEVGDADETPVNCEAFDGIAGGIGAWKRRLISGIAGMNGCLFFRERRGQFRMIGRACDREVVEYLCVYLVREIQRAGEADYAVLYLGRRRSLKRARRFMQSFGHTAVVEILARMRGERMAGAMALVVRRDEANREFAKAEGLDLVTSESTVRLDAIGAVAGARAGRRIEWHGGVRGASQTGLVA